MKKLYAMVAVAALSLSIGVTAMAQGMTGKKSCSSCNKTAEATPEQMKKFKVESLDLRQEMMNKRFELQRENLKETPDQTKITAIKAEMDAIRVKIEAVRTANKLPAGKSCCNEEAGMMGGSCDKCNMMGGKAAKKGKKAAKHGAASCGCSDCGMKGDCKNCTDKANCDCSKKK